MVDSSPPARLRWIHWMILAALIAVGAVVRFYQITEVSQWPDEFWSSVHAATGRGTAIFDLPEGILMNPPPQTMLRGAPPWFHIWTGISNITHPPVYLLALRFWMDLFGDGDLSTRSLSAVASLAGVLLLFDIMRRTTGLHVALLAAALMAIAPMQIDMSQQARPYTFLVLMGLWVCRSLLRIEQKGANFWRLAQLALAMALTALTHYFALGALFGLIGYAMVRLAASDRRKTAAAIALSAVFTLAIWGPFLWQQRQQMVGPQRWSLEYGDHPLLPLLNAGQVPAYLLYARNSPASLWIALAIVAYSLPILYIRRDPKLMLWWSLIVGVIGQLLIYDVLRRSHLLAYPKYTFLASAGLYAIYASPQSGRAWWRWLVPYTILASTIITTIERLQEGPREENGDWRGMALMIDRLAAPRDPLIFCPNNFWGSAGMPYLDFSHYVQNSRRPVMFLTHRANQQTLDQLAKYPRVWLIGPDVGDNYQNYLPGWKRTSAKGYFNVDMICGVVPERTTSNYGVLPPATNLAK